MSVWLNNYKYIYLRSIYKNKVIYEGKYIKISSKRKYTNREYNVQNNTDIAQKMWKSIVIQTNSQHYHFVVQIQILKRLGGWVSILIYILIKN